MLGAHASRFVEVVVAIVVALVLVVLVVSSNSSSSQPIEPLTYLPTFDHLPTHLPYEINTLNHPIELPSFPPTYLPSVIHFTIMAGVPSRRDSIMRMLQPIVWSRRSRRCPETWRKVSASGLLACGSKTSCRLYRGSTGSWRSSKACWKSHLISSRLRWAARILGASSQSLWWCRSVSMPRPYRSMLYTLLYSAVHCSTQSSEGSMLERAPT